jgi:hypothetical protein
MDQVRIFIALISIFSATKTFASAVEIFSQRDNFYSATGARVVDDFENQKYINVMSDATMSAVVGETEYYTYGGNIADYNNTMTGFGAGGSKAYCSLCYGSFRLSFQHTSISMAGGVYGVGIDVTENAGAMLPYKYSALVTFANGTTERFEVPYVAPLYPSIPSIKFWGITAESGIRSVDFLSYSSAGPDRTYLIIDNLTISAAPVPEGSTFALLLAGLCTVFLVTSSKRSGA